MSRIACRVPSVTTTIHALVKLGEARIGARIEFDRTTEALRSAVVTAYRNGETKVAIARDAQIDRSTVTEWINAAEIAAARAAAHAR